MLVSLETKKNKREYGEKWKDLRPQSALLYIENKCHLKCQHCYESEVSHPKAYKMSLAEYCDLFDQLADLGVLYLTLSGGEIFLRRDCLEIIEEARKRRFSIDLFTSGTHINAAKAKRLKELNVRQVEISIYSHIASVHDDFTQVKGSHQKSLQALANLKEEGVKIAIKSNLMTFNVDHIDGMIELAESLGASWSFDPTVKVKMDGSRDPLKFALSPEVIRKKILNRPELYSAFRKYEPSDLCDGKSSLIDKEGVLCGAARSHFAIAADGGVLACSFYPEAADNIKKHSLKEIWFSSKQFNQIRETTFDKMQSCQSCDVSSTCSPCMAYSVVENDNPYNCVTSSRQLAQSISLLAERKVQKDFLLKSHHLLPLVGQQEFIPPEVKAKLDTE